MRGKNDAIDAAAICEAISRPDMRYVPVKSAEQQAGLMLVSTRDLLVKQRTMLVNAMRGHAAEFGVTAAKGRVKVAELMQKAHAPEAGVPALALAMLDLLAGQLAALDAQIEAVEGSMMRWHKHDQLSQCLATQPGIGPITAVSFSLKVPDQGLSLGPAFRRLDRYHPKEHSTGGRARPGGISRQSLPRT